MKTRWILAGLAIVIAGFVGSVVWANLHALRNRSREKATARLLYKNAMVLEHYREDTGAYPTPNFIGSAVALTKTLAAYGELFQPTDGWGRPLLYSCSHDGSQYSIMSLGSNATAEFVGTTYQLDERGFDNSAVDMIIQNGEWLSYDLGYGDPGGRVMPNDEFFKALQAIQHK